MAESGKRINYVHPAALGDTLRSIQEHQHSLTVHVEELLQRANSVDPHVRAFLSEPQRRPRVLQATKERRARRGREEPMRLYGATVGVKDIFHVDGFVTRAGSNLPSQLFAGGQAAVVTQLVDAGAIVMGKTVTTEFAYFEPGPTRNPHNLEHTPGGSSSGSAAAVAAGLCTLALGTQTIGSVIRPAAFCGIVGYKPSLSRINPAGLVFFSRTMDHVGLFTQDVEGMEVAASVLCADWSPARRTDATPVLGVPDGPYLAQADESALRKFEEQVLLLQVAGYTVKRVRAFDDIASLNDLHRRLVFAEFAQEHARWFDDFESLYRPRTAEAIRAGRAVSPEALVVARANGRALRKELERLMEREGIDLWVCPAATGEAPRGIAATGDPNMNLPWTHAGMPAITVPAGPGEGGLPLGLQLVAMYGLDEALLAWAREVAKLSFEAKNE